MPTKNQNLHGSAPDKSETALLLIDVINDLEFPEAEQMLPAAATNGGPGLRGCGSAPGRRMCRCMYVNDNFGKWRSDFGTTRSSIA